MTSKMWTWISGNNSMSQVGAYGTRGVAATGNNPGSRYFHGMLVDSINQLIYVFGGSGYGAGTSTGNFTNTIGFI